MENKSSERSVLTELVQRILTGTELVAFKYDSGFTIHLQRDPGSSHKRLPVQVSLVLRAKWLIRASGDNAAIDSMLSLHSERWRCKPEQPCQAYKLMTLVGQKVVCVELSENSNLLLQFLDGISLEVSGREDEWDFSWYAFVPSDFPGIDAWSVNCDANGELTGAWPNLEEPGLPGEVDMPVI